MVAKAVKGLSAEDLWRIERIATPEISPCGRKAVFSVTRYDMNSNVGRSNLYWVDLASNKASEKPQALTSAGDRDASPQWSPNGDRIAFVAKREQSGVKDEAAQLYVIAAHGGESQRLTQWPLGVGAFRWMPDGKRIVFISWVWPEQKTTRAQIKRHMQETNREPMRNEREVSYRSGCASAHNDACK
jgi:dipeptidyl aminopeptidase/acylaminoacyl peptidase